MLYNVVSLNVYALRNVHKTLSTEVKSVQSCEGGARSSRGEKGLRQLIEKNEQTIASPGKRVFERDILAAAGKDCFEIAPRRIVRRLEILPVINCPFSLSIGTEIELHSALNRLRHAVIARRVKQGIVE